MNTCEKCGAYIPIGETACPACGYDPAEKEKRAREEARRQAAEEARRRAAEMEEERRRTRAAQEEARQWKARAEEAERRQQGGAQYAYQAAPETERREQTWSAPWEQRQQPRYARPMNYRQAKQYKAKNKWVALALCFFTGWFGGHKFYEGKWGLGLLYLFTYGLFGVGWMVDLLRLLIQPEDTYYVE